MPVCHRRGAPINPGAALDRVISQAANDDCVLYKLADYLKGGRLLEEYARGGGREVEKLVLEEFGIFMYNSGHGMEVTRTEFLKWKYRSVPKDQLLVHMEPKSPFDPLRKWRDHEACWRMQYRGTLGETLLHVLIMCDTKAHTRVAKILLKCFPKLALDVVEGEEYLGASALHLAIAYHNNDLVTVLIKCGANINQRAIGSFFLPTDQQFQRPKGPRFSDYEGLAYLGELPLAWAACLGNETVYNKLIDCGADPNLQDSFGNMILHMVVVCNQLGMFSYALRHPRMPAQDGIMNAAGLTPLTLACRLARSTIFKEMLELTCIEFWRYSNITCSAYPLNALDTIRPSGETNWNSALMIILNGTKAEHLDMLEGGIIQRLLEEKWKTFARNQFLKRLIIMLLQLVALSVTIYLRPCYCPPAGLKLGSAEMNRQLYDDFFEVNTQSIIRYCFEALTMVGMFWYTFIQQGEEIRNQGLKSFMKGLTGDAPKLIFLVSNFLLLACVPCRVAYLMTPDYSPSARATEDELLAYACAGSWFMMMFFAGALKLTGPFVVMIYKMISGDMFTFSIIYGIMLLGFSQAFYFLYKRGAVPDKDSKFVTYGTTWMALFHMTLGDYDYGAMSQNIYSALTKFVFLVFTIMLPIMLLNMLIAMMGNTYSTVISQSEKEWVKAWAKIVIALERAVSKTKAKEFLYKYSVPLGGGGEDGGEENLGVMVIKCKDKTKAKQRKGALSNWKRVGKVTIKALKRRGVSGEFLRREMWGLCSAQSTPLHGVKKKGGAGAYNVTAGVSTNLEDVLYGEDEDSDFDADANDGFGALTGAIDKLAFTNDLDFSGDGVDDDDPLKPMRPEQATAEALRNRGLQDQGAGMKGKKKNGIDNQAFLGDEELLLAAAVAADNEDSDDPDGTKRARKKSKVVANTCGPATPGQPTYTNTGGYCTGPPGAQGLVSYPGAVTPQMGANVYPNGGGYMQPGPPGQCARMPGPNFTMGPPQNGMPPYAGVQTQYPGAQTPYAGNQINYPGAYGNYSAPPQTYPGAMGPHVGGHGQYPGAGTPYLGGQPPAPTAQGGQYPTSAPGGPYPGNIPGPYGGPAQTSYPGVTGPHAGVGAPYQGQAQGYPGASGAYPNAGMQPGNYAGVVTVSGPGGQNVVASGQPTLGKLPPLFPEKRSRPISARIRRLGSAQKKKPNFDKTLKHLQPVARGNQSNGAIAGALQSSSSTAMRVVMPGIPNPDAVPTDTMSSVENPSAVEKASKDSERDDKKRKDSKEEAKTVQKSRSLQKSVSVQGAADIPEDPQHEEEIDAEIESRKRGSESPKASDGIPQCSTETQKGSIDSEKAPSVHSQKQSVDSRKSSVDSRKSFQESNGSAKRESSKSEGRDCPDEQWADKKTRKKNRVGPSVDVEDPPEAEEEELAVDGTKGPQDDANIGLDSGTDSTKHEVKANEKKQRPKTCVASGNKFGSESVGDMSTILPWNNEDGDIKQ